MMLRKALTPTPSETTFLAALAGPAGPPALAFCSFFDFPRKLKEICIKCLLSCYERWGGGHAADGGPNVSVRIRRLHSLRPRSPVVRGTGTFI